jgi:hypothetical protein
MKLVIFFIFFVIAGCAPRDQEAQRERVYRKLIIGEWKPVCLIFCDDVKLVFNAEFYQQLLRPPGSLDWTITADSLKYRINGETVYLEKKSPDQSGEHRITWLDQQYFEYEDKSGDQRKAFSRP